MKTGTFAKSKKEKTTNFARFIEVRWKMKQDYRKEREYFVKMCKNASCNKKQAILQALTKWAQEWSRITERNHINGKICNDTTSKEENHYFCNH